MSKNLTRRNSVKTIIGFGAFGPIAGHIHAGTARVSPNGRLNLAAVGAAGKGWEDLTGASGSGERHNMVALCDIDHRNGGEQPSNLGKGQAARPLGLGRAAELFPKAKLYTDFRKLLEQKDIDAITVSTPDHMHATVALSAMQLGKHVYVQKPLTQTVHESRIMREVAEKTGVTTQMGNQFHSSALYRTAVEVIQSGVIGKVREVHASTSSPSWPQGISRRAGGDPIPEGVDWDLWIGVAEPRPYLKHTYHNFNWRGWKEFGTGALGDMGCHIIDPAKWSLDLGAPKEVTAKVFGPAEETYPESSIVIYRFPGTKYTTDEFTLYWYDGSQVPASAEMAKLVAENRNGTVYIGEKGIMTARHGFNIPRLFPKEDFLDYSRTTLKETYQGFVDEKLDHYQVWTDAILAGKPGNSHFGYAGPLNEIVTVGTVAQRLPERILKWDAPSLCFDDPDATALVRRKYRKGWEIEALVG